MPRPLTILLAWLLPLACLPQAPSQEKLPSPPPPVDALQGGWDNHVANIQAAEWKNANANVPNNAMVQLNWFRSEYNAKASNNNGQLKPADRVLLNTIANDIKSTAPGSFEQHLADYYLEFPAPKAFTDLDVAYALAPDRNELLAPMLTHAMREGDAEAQATWCKELEQNRAIAPSLLAVASDVLSSIGPNGILFTNGDMDTQPAIVRQLRHDQRPDVLVVDQRLLEDEGYRNRTWKQAGADGRVPVAGPAFAQALLSETQRPVYLALSLDPSWFEAFAGHLHAIGAAFRVGEGAEDDATLLEQHWSAMRKPMDAGPMSRNYLLPGAILLAHYRESGNEAKATALEKELRTMSTATGAFADLLKLGVIEH